MDGLTVLNTFVEAAEACSFTVAGRKLGISSLAVGNAIARLEERLGVRLFHRSTRSIALMPEGDLFLARCQRILGEVEAAELELAENAGGAARAAQDQPAAVSTDCGYRRPQC